MMNITTLFKIGTFTLTAVVSSLLVWLDFPAHQGALAGLMVFLSGLMVLFCYELYSRACAYMGQKHWEQKDVLSSVLKYSGYQNDLVSSTLKIVDFLQQQQKQLLQRTERISSSVVAAVDLLTKLVEHVEESAGKEIRGVAVLLEVLQQQQKDVLEKVTRLQDEVVDGMLKPLEERMEKSSQKGLEAMVQLQKSFEISAKRDLEAKEKLVEIVSGLTN